MPPAGGARSKKTRAGTGGSSSTATATTSPIKPPGRTTTGASRANGSRSSSTGAPEGANGDAEAGPSSSRIVYLYPSAAERPEDLTAAQQELKVARHSPCLAGQDDEEDDNEHHVCACKGFRPPKGSAVRAKPVKQRKTRKRRSAANAKATTGDTEEEEEEEEEEEAMSVDRLPEEDEDADAAEQGPEGLQWSLCDCGHELSEHGRLAEEGAEERRRRVRVAVRLDELLEDEDKLLDWDFVNDDLLSLRKQMLPPGSRTANGNSLGKRKSRSNSPATSSALSSPTTSIAGSPDAKRRKLSLASPVKSETRRTANGAAVPRTDVSSDAAAGEGEGIGKRPAQGARALADQTGETQAGAETTDEGKGVQADETQGKDSLPEIEAAPISAVTKGIAIDTAEMMPAEPAAAGALGKEQETDAATAAEEPETAVEDEEEEESVRPPPQRPVIGGLDAGPAPRRERPAVIEERAGLIQFRVVENDGTSENMILLTGLKNIFQRQLPKMPREYITRLVLDRNHMSMAIVKRGLQVVGGITYRPFNHRKFAEIVFCAITGTEQVKGYGSHLMNHLKDHVRSTSPVMHFLTYADNYAIGYFKKQGFTKEISLDRCIWVGYIKDYEGGTLMQCSMVPRVQYLKVQDLLAEQKAAVLAKIREKSKSHIVHPGLKIFKNRKESDPPIEIDPSEVPGLKESGWTPAMDELARRPKRGPHHSVMRQILMELNNHPAAWPFLNPVNVDEVTDYYDVIKEPMDLSTMETKMENNQYDTLDEFLKDAQLIFDNCRKYNPATSTYAKQANRLEKYLKDNIQAWRQAGGL